MTSRLRLPAWLAVGVVAMTSLAAACTTPATETTPTAEATSDLASATPTASSVPASSHNLTPDEIVAAHELVLADIFERVVPSVVRISARSGLGSADGSGWVWDEQGHIVTNYHVISDATSVNVAFFDGSEFDAEIVGGDPDSDMAVLKIDPGDKDLVPAELGDDSILRPGQMAIALGNPFGQDQEFTMTTGIVSALGRLIASGFGDFSIPGVVQTDAAINPGNSGGPLLDRHGRVIGTNTQIRSSTRQNSGVGFAVPVNLTKRVVPSIIEDGRHEYSYLGITTRDLNKELREFAELPPDVNGALVQQVLPDTPADKAGIRGGTESRPLGGQNVSLGGDILNSVDSMEFRRMDELISYLALNTSPGDVITLGGIRDGEPIEFEVELEPRPRGGA
ncbi:MAG: trypsin-like peptidase domain-containing protein [Dehalococcoidia bacterium]